MDGVMKEQLRALYVGLFDSFEPYFGGVPVASISIMAIMAFRLL